MIERSAFIKLLQKLDMAFESKLTFTQEKIDLWYEMFKDCNEVGLTQAVDRCIKESEFAPNVAGLMKYYRQIEETHNDLVRCVKSEYRSICSIWGEPYDFQTESEIYAYVNRFPRETRKTEMVELAHRAISFKHDCEACGRTDVPTILEYVKGMR